MTVEATCAPIALPAAPRPAAPRVRSTPLYRLIIEALEMRRRELAWSFEVCDAKSGLQRGYTAKMFHPDTKSGRIATWPTLQLLVDTLYAGEGFRLFMVPDKVRRFSGSVTPMMRLLGMLELAGQSGPRAAALLAEWGVEAGADGMLTIAADRAEHKRENRRRKTRQTVRTKIRKSSAITAAQS